MTVIEGGLANMHQNISICILTECTLPDIGGGVTQTVSLAKGWIKNGFNVFFLTQTKGLHLLGYECVDGIPIYRVTTTSDRFGKYLMLLPAFFYLYKYRRRYNIIFVPGFRILGVLAVLAAKLFKKRSLLKAEGAGELKGEVFKWGSPLLKLPLFSGLTDILIRLRNIILLRADRFIAISYAIENEFIKCGVRQEKISHIPNGIDIKRFQPAGAEEKKRLREKLKLPPSKRICIYTGRLNKGKGLELLLSVWKRLCEEGIDGYLVLLGSGSYQFLSVEDELRNFARINNLESKVIFPGYVSNVEEYLMASDIFALPSQTEGFSCSVAEAVSCGLFVVSTNVGGTPDIIRNDNIGMLVNPNSKDELYEAMRKVITSAPAVVPALSSEYRMEDVIRRYVSIFYDIGISISD